jgi:hypothetical protein
MAKRYMEKWSMSVVTRGKQTKTTVRCHLTLVRMAVIKKDEREQCWLGCGAKETFLCHGGNVNYWSYYGEQYEVSSKAKL